MRDIVITDFSAVTPFGLTTEEFGAKMFAGRSAVGGLEAIITEPDFPIRCAALLPQGFYPPLNENQFAEEIETLVHATLQGLNPAESNCQFDAIVYGTNEGLARFLDVDRHTSGARFSTAHLDPAFGLQVVTSRLAQYGQRPLVPKQLIVVGGACTTGLMALHYAMQMIRSGRSRRILVLCAESRLRVEELLKLNAFGALSRAACAPEEVSRPFSKSRSGFVRGEGAGAIVVESREWADQRGASIHASVLGSAVTSDAWRLTDGREDLVCAEKAIEKALASANVRAEQIDYINAHGTATLKNDRLETCVIKKVFGRAAYSTPVSSLKSQIGHLNFACGLVEVIACLLMFQKQQIAPTINLHDPDPDCDLDYVPNQSRPASLNRILKTGFGFGGSNAAVVLGRI